MIKRNHPFKFLPIILVLAVIQSCVKSSETNTETVSEFDEKYRPQYHFTPPSQWMNDPNGMVYFNGTYHLYYQHFPDSNVWGPMHWGHATSTDMVNWEHQPIAIFPDSLGYIFSGSAVVDWENTSGFGTDENPALVAIYTYHDPVGEKAGAIDFQYQGIAYSLDEGTTWTKYEANPILSNPGIRDFRDPKVFWHEKSEQWKMILAVKDHVRLFSSSDLKSWRLESEFGREIGQHGGVWECPDLFQLKDQSGESKWVMLVSINPAGPQGGSATQYFVGDFDGSVFMPADSTIRWIDWGADNYAGVTWSDVPEEDGRRLFIGWMSNWQYAQVVPTSEWRSAMTIPRSLILKKTDSDWIVQSKPVEELASVIGETVELIEENTINASSFVMTINDVGQDFQLILSNETDRLPISIGEAVLSIDRTDAGLSEFSEDFAMVHEAPIQDIELKKLQIFVDRSSVEVFLNDGEVVMTDLVFPKSPWTQISLKGDYGLADISEIRSIWK